MPPPPRPITELAQEAVITEKASRYPSKAWLNSAEKLFIQAEDALRVKDLERAYVAFVRGITIVVEVVPKCRDHTPDDPFFQKLNKQIESNYIHHSESIKKDLSEAHARYQNDVVNPTLSKSRHSSSTSIDSKRVSKQSSFNNQEIKSPIIQNHPISVEDELAARLNKLKPTKTPQLQPTKTPHLQPTMIHPPLNPQISSNNINNPNTSNFYQQFNTQPTLVTQQQNQNNPTYQNFNSSPTLKSNTPPIPTRNTSLKIITPQELHFHLSNHPNSLVLDVRAKEIFLHGHIAWKRSLTNIGGVICCEPEWFDHLLMDINSLKDIIKDFSFGSTGAMEQKIFDTYSSTSLVVIHDQSSIQYSPILSRLAAIFMSIGMINVKMLLGGYDAWLGFNGGNMNEWIEIGEGVGEVKNGGILRSGHNIGLGAMSPAPLKSQASYTQAPTANQYSSFGNIENRGSNINRSAHDFVNQQQQTPVSQSHSRSNTNNTLNQQHSRESTKHQQLSSNSSFNSASTSSNFYPNNQQIVYNSSLYANGSSHHTTTNDFDPSQGFNLPYRNTGVEYGTIVSSSGPISYPSLPTAPSRPPLPAKPNFPMKNNNTPPSSVSSNHSSTDTLLESPEIEAIKKQINEKQLQQQKLQQKPKLPVKPPPPVASSTTHRRCSSPSPSPVTNRYYTPTINNVPPALPPKPKSRPSSSDTVVEKERVSVGFSGLGQVTFGLSGLKNLGNTCFMNSIIQCLSATIPLSRYFLDGSFKRHLNRTNKHGSKGRLTESLALLIKTMWSAQEPVITPSAFKDIVGGCKSQFRGTEQQDSQEFLGFLLDCVHEDLNILNNIPTKRVEEVDEDDLPDPIASERAWTRYTEMNWSIIVDMFQGQYMNQLQCMTCNKTSTTFNTFMYLTLPIPEKNSIGQVGGSVYLEECLDKFTEVEVMSNGEEWRCPRCKVPRKSLKQLSLSRLPPILLIHLKRFSQEGPFRDKIETYVEFPVSKLNMDKYLPKWRLDMDGDLAEYELYALSNHYGGLNGGHYTAIAKRQGQQWHNFDDSRINVTGENSIRSEAAYILFYARKGFQLKGNWFSNSGSRM